MSSSRHSSRSRENRRPEYRRQERTYDKPERASKLFVTNIDSKYDEEELRKELTDSFSKYGDIKEIIIKTKLGSLNSYAFIQFNSIQEADKALQELNRVDFLGKQLKVEFSRGPKNRREMHCYICRRDGHLARQCTDNRRGYHHKRQRSRSGEGRRYGGGKSRSRSRSDRRRYRNSRSRSGERRRDDRDKRRDRDYDRRRYGGGSRSASPRRYQNKRRYSRDRSGQRNNR